MAESKVGKSKPEASIYIARNLALQPREFKIGNHWYKWNACGTKGDELDITSVINHKDFKELKRYFTIREVNK